MRIEYPTIDKEGNLTEVEKDAKVAKYFGHRNTLGFYPIGRLNTWHGGIHIEGEKKQINAIADGRIIAYKLSEEYCTLKNDAEAKFSNSFVLMQHNYKSPKEQKFRFYSLYMHLMPKMQMEAKKMIPDIFGYYTGKVIGKESLIGLNARSGRETVTGKKLGIKKTVIPVGATVSLNPLPSEPSYAERLMADVNDYSDEIVSIPNSLPTPFDIERKKYWVAKKKLQDTIDNHWSSDESVKDYRYKRVRYGDWTDIYIATTSKYVKDLGDNKLQIISCAANIINVDNTATQGVVVYDKPNNTGQGKYLRTIAKDTDLGELKKVNEQWFKMPGKEEYVAASALDVSKTVKDSIVLNAVQNVDIEIKAGTTLGYSGTNAIKNRRNYSTVHLEIFTDDKAVNDFIANKTGDDNRNQYQVPANRSLQIGKPVNNLNKDTKVKIYEYKGNYAQVGFEDIEGVTRYEYLSYHPVKNGLSYYTIKQGNLADVNTSFENLLTNESDKLYWVSRADEAGNSITEAQEKKNIEEAKKNGTKYIKYRKVKWKHTRNEQKYWVKSNAVPSADLLQPMQAMQPIGVSGMQAGAQGTTAQITAPSNAANDNSTFEPCWVKLTADVDVVYDKEPNDENTADISIGEIIQVQRKIATATDNNGDKWFKIKGQYFEEEIKKTTEGWIKESELTVINPYNWQEFNWQLQENAGNQYIYRFDTKENEEPHDFIKTIWNLVDTNGDKVLTQFELQNAMRSEEKVNILSKIICKHQSEWDTWQNIDTFESEVKTLYQKGIEKEDYPEEKQQLEQARDERISQLKEKIEKLCFWGDVQDGDIGTPKDGIPARTFPSDSNVYHFHPIAFVEQMKMITAPTMPPWMEIAIEKAIMAGGAHESQEPLYSFAKKCLELGGSKARPDDNEYGQWCGGFVGWCLNESKYKIGTQAWEILSSQRYVFLAKTGKFYKIVDEPIVGCIVVMTNYLKSNGKSKGSGHICYLYGIDGNNLVCLGGNQGSYLKFSNFKRTGVSYDGSDYEQKFNCFLMPMDYPESYYNMQVPTITAEQANKQYNINLETKLNESTT